MADVSADFQSGFWRGHVRLGAGSTAVCAVVGLAYSASTWSHPHRLVTLCIGVLALLSCPAIVSGPGLRILTGPSRTPFLYAWSASLLLAVGATSALDGGGRSPLSLLFTASLVFTASGFDRTGAVVMGAATVGGYLLVCLTGSPGPWPVALFATSLAVLAATCALTAERLRRSVEIQERLTEQLRWQASHDGLTGCLNHAAFLERVEHEVRRAHRLRQPLGILMLDLDDFKRANDTFGHVVADELLTALGQALRETVRGGDVVGRVGGDEFAVVVPDTDEHATALLAARIKEELTSVGAATGVGVSIGTAALCTGDDGRELRQRADQALYAAKRAQRRTMTLP